MSIPTVKHPLLVNIQEAWDVAKPFQIEDAEFGASKGNMVLGYQTGLGKTFSTLLTLSLWPNAQKVLIVGSLSSMAVWWRLLRRWGGVDPLFFQGQKSFSAWQQFLSQKTGVGMCTYATHVSYMNKADLRIGHRPQFDLVIDDELHRALRSKKTAHKAHSFMEYDHYIGCSATWASRGPQDTWPVLNLVAPTVFPSYWRFVNTWCHVEDGTFGKEIYGVKNPDNFKKMLWGGYYRGRSWKHEGHYFGRSGEPVIRRPEIVSMTKRQAKMIQRLQTDMFLEQKGKFLATPNALSLLTRSLQLAISPRILFPDEEFGGPVDWLIERVAEDPHTVIYCPFVEGLSVMKEALIKDGRKPEHIFILKGGTSPAVVNAAIAAWKACRGVMLCTIAFAQSFDFDTTYTAYMLGFLWDPNDNYQAEGRLRRADSLIEGPCLCRYIIPDGSDYFQVRDVVDGKVRNVQQFLVGYGLDHNINVDAPNVFQL